MSRYLVVAHQTVTNPMLLEQLMRVKEEDESAEFVLLVPATPVRHLLFRRGTEQEASAVARELADKALDAFEKNQVNLVEARVGSASPEEAIDNEVKDHPGYVGFVISTLAQEKSRWVGLDLPGRVASKYGLPVYHVQAPIDFFASEMP